MKAVNLIPLDERRGADAPSRSGGAVYGVLGILGVLAVAATLYGLALRNADQQQAELERLTAGTTQAETKAAALAPYSKFQKVAAEREQTVLTITDQRFDWGPALREIARVVPDEVDLSTLTGSRGGDASATASAVPGATPQFQLVGCAASQSDVALLLARLRAIDGVERVRLDTSAKSEGGQNAGQSGGSADCRKRAGDAQFTAVVFFGDAGGSAPAASVPASGGASPPAPSAPGQAPAGPGEGAS